MLLYSQAIKKRTPNIYKHSTHNKQTHTHTHTDTQTCTNILRNQKKERKNNLRE